MAGLRRIGLAVTVGMMVAPLLVACSTDVVGSQVTLSVRDLGLRTEGAECSGSSSLMYLHAGATYSISDGARNVLVSGELPAGVAAAAFTVDLTGAVRIPTVCNMIITLSAPLSGSAAWLTVDAGEPIRLLAATTGSWLAQIPEAPAQWTGPTSTPPGGSR